MSLRSRNRGNVCISWFRFLFCLRFLPTHSGRFAPHLARLRWRQLPPAGSAALRADGFKILPQLLWNFFAHLSIFIGPPLRSRDSITNAVRGTTLNAPNRQRFRCQAQQRRVLFPLNRPFQDRDRHCRCHKRLTPFRRSLRPPPSRQRNHHLGRFQHGRLCRRSVPVRSLRVHMPKIAHFDALTASCCRLAHGCRPSALAMAVMAMSRAVVHLTD